MKQPDHESAHYGELPDINQVETLNRTMLLFAQRHNTLRIGSKGSGKKSFRMADMRQFECPPPDERAPFGFLIKKGLGAYAVRDTLEATWKLHIADTFEAIDKGSTFGGQRTIYQFKWNDEGTVERATKKSRRTPVGDVQDIIDVVDTLSMPQDPDWTLIMDSMTQSMQPGDLELLTTDIQRRFGEVDRDEKAYVIPRKALYVDYMKGTDS